MSDQEVIQSIVENILTAINRIERRFQSIQQPKDFLTSDQGIDRLDGITMMLIAIGEQVKQLDKITAFELKSKYPEVDWRGVKGTRDFLSHHYFMVDAEIIFDVCENKLSNLKAAIQDMQKSNG